MWDLDQNLETKTNIAMFVSRLRDHISIARYPLWPPSQLFRHEPQSNSVHFLSPDQTALEPSTIWTTNVCIRVVDCRSLFRIHLISRRQNNVIHHRSVHRIEWHSTNIRHCIVLCCTVLRTFYTDFSKTTLVRRDSRVPFTVQPCSVPNS